MGRRKLARAPGSALSSESICPVEALDSQAQRRAGTPVMADGQGPGAVRAYEGLEGLEGAGLMCIRPRRNQGYGTCGIVRNLACMLQAPSHQGACRLVAGTVHS